MLGKEALALLETAPVLNAPSAANRSITQKQGVAIVVAAIKEYDPEKPIPPIMEKRVWQVTKNQKRPQY